MRVIIAGSRTIADFSEVETAIKNSGFAITEVISGGCAGPDLLGERWALHNLIPKRTFVADWKNLGKAAGPIRNSEMAANADALILIWDGESRGSQDMLNKANVKGLKVHVHLVKKETTK